MRLASYVPGELIPCAFVWLDPGITPCCKSHLRDVGGRSAITPIATELLCRKTDVNGGPTASGLPRCAKGR